MMNIEAVISYNTKALRHLYNVMESNVRSLKSLGVTADFYGSLLASVLMNKQPIDLCLIISRKVGEDEWDLGIILREFLTEIEARERTAVNSPPMASSQGKKPTRGQQAPSIAATLQNKQLIPSVQLL